MDQNIIEAIVLGVWILLILGWCVVYYFVDIKGNSSIKRIDKHIYTFESIEFDEYEMIISYEEIEEDHG